MLQKSKNLDFGPLGYQFWDPPDSLWDPPGAIWGAQTSQEGPIEGTIGDKMYGVLLIYQNFLKPWNDNEHAGSGGMRNSEQWSNTFYTSLSKIIIVKKR